MPKSPCLDCERRVIGCHARCEEYRGFLKDLKAYKEKRRQYNQTLSPPYKRKRRFRWDTNQYVKKWRDKD